MINNINIIRSNLDAFRDGVGLRIGGIGLLLTARAAAIAAAGRRTTGHRSRHQVLGRLHVQNNENADYGSHEALRDGQRLFASTAQGSVFEFADDGGYEGVEQRVG